MTETSERQKRFKTLYDRITVTTVHGQASASNGHGPAMEPRDIAFLMSNASRLSLSEDKKNLAIAYDVTIKLIELFGTELPGLVESANTIFARLGNFPACTVTGKRFKSNGENFRLSLPALEVLSREQENTVVIQNSDIVLTDFQHQLFDVRAKWPSVSVSAPTSAGKSFLIALDIVRFLLKNKGSTVVVLVPTRALIRQVMCDVIEQLNAFNLPDVRVSCVPESVTPEARGEGQVLVFTQERLTTLLNDKGSSDDIGLLVVDEAQELGDDSRGIVLQAAIERTLLRNPATELLFACPLRSNPGFLLTLFRRQTQGLFFTEEHSPVSQNVILVSGVADQTKQASLELLDIDGRIPIGIVEMPHALRGPATLANAALSFTRDGDASIVYANGARAAEKIALDLASKLDPIENVPQEITDVIEFVKNHVHKRYPLVETLPRGVAFHYGDMPDVVRMGIEDLFRAGKLKFVCCTSTLLQGVNLPAKNVFMLKPTRGKNNALDVGAFWNLAGRAGRMRYEYGGNVWCLLPKTWKKQPFEGTRLVELESALQSALEGRSNKIYEVIEKSDTASEKKDTKTAEQAFGKIFSDVSAGRDPIEPDISDAGKEALDKITRLCGELVQRITIPVSVFEKNSGVSPHRLEELAAYLRSSTNLNSILPMHPELAGALPQLKRVFGVCDTVFFKLGNKKHEYFATIAYWWMRGETLKGQIEYALKVKKVPDEPVKIAAAIRTLLGDLSTEIRYKYVKYLRAYHDVMEQVLTGVGLQGLIPSMAPLHLFIEYGSANNTLIHLMAIGLSRATAIIFAQAAGMRANMNRVDVEKVFDRTDLFALNLPALSINEILSLRRKVPVS